MTNKECRNTRREIDELELGHRPSLAATAHMAACSACQTFQAERTSLRELVGSLEPVVAPPDFDMRLRARIAADKYEKRQQPFFARLVSTPALAAAALFVTVAGSVVWISRRPNPAVTPSKTEVATKTNQSNVLAPVNQSEPQNVTPASEEAPIPVASNNGSNRGRHRGIRSGGSEDFSVQGTDRIRQTDSDQAFVRNRPVEFALQDESGKTRRISVPPVSFGAQNLVGNNRREVSYPQTSRVW
jgi:hypothetical protein